MKLLLIAFMAICLTSCETRPIPVPFNVTKQYTEGKFDTILSITGDDYTYYFKMDQNLSHRIDNSQISTDYYYVPEWIGWLLIIIIVACVVVPLVAWATSR